MKTQKQRCGIFLGGAMFHKLRPKEGIERLNYLIAADSGCDMLLQLGFLPHLLLGDMDSISPYALSACRENGVEILEFPVNKDFTDGEMALYEAVKRGYTHLEIYAAYGSRFDHTLANVFTAVPYAAKGVAITFVNENFTAYLTTGNLHIEGQKGDLVSLLPLTESVSEVTLQGFEYPLNQETLFLGSARGLSNVLAASSGNISHAGGILLVVHYPQKKENI